MGGVGGEVGGGGDVSREGCWKVGRSEDLRGEVGGDRAMGGDVGGSRALGREVGGGRGMGGVVGGGGKRKRNLGSPC